MLDKPSPTGASTSPMPKKPRSPKNHSPVPRAGSTRFGKTRPCSSYPGLDNSWSEECQPKTSFYGQVPVITGGMKKAFALTGPSHAQQRSFPKFRSIPRGADPASPPDPSLTLSAISHRKCEQNPSTGTQQFFSKPVGHIPPSTPAFSSFA